ncbi:MAG: hypothetical protein RIT14_1666 [Pseudomonadota bacterium]|jgi:hypothetical protein
MEGFAERGWRRVVDPAIGAWAHAARGQAVRAMALPRDDWRCGETWCVGLDALDNAPDGSVAGVALPWGVLGLDPVPLHRGQVSVVRPGYPQPWDGETEAGFRFRRDRDAAHLDGLLPVGPQKRRMVQEPHGWILGIPLNSSGVGASPLVVWEGSHRVMRAGLAGVLRGDPAGWAEVDVTEAYQAARRQVFETCRRVELPGAPGEAVVLHRLMIHGVAPWAAGAMAEEPGRMVAYFRPLLPSVEAWLTLP